jgi:cellobiose transport system substrate-binding protein
MLGERSNVGAHPRLQRGYGMKWSRSRVASIAALGAASALVLGACSSNSGSSPSAPASSDSSSTTDAPSDDDTASGEQVELSVAFWGDFGLQSEGDNLVEQYESENPNIKIKLIPGEHPATHEALQQYLIAGSGAPDVQAIDLDYVVQFRQQSDKFVNLLEYGAGDYKDRYLDWKWAQMESDGGNVNIGLGTDIGPQVMCYRWDLFQEAGLPYERDEVSAAIGGSWDDFIEFGKKYVEASGKKFVDNAVNIYQPVLGQQPVASFTEDEELALEGGPKVAFDTALKVVEAGLSANLAAWSPEWNAGFENGDFAVLACPAWMRGHIKNSAPSTEGKWDLATIPGGGGNWGGSFWTIPAQSAHPQEAYDFIEWLIQPEQQIRIFKNVGNLPSQIAVLESEEIQNSTDPFFNNAPDGKIFGESALALKPQYIGVNESVVRNAMQNALNAVQGDQLAAADAWDKAVADVNAELP